jgi:hypothetical protein
VGQAAEGRENDHRRQKDFIGIFYPVLKGLPIVDARRCPDASHPLLMTFDGVAYTNLGQATFEQSHCVDFDQTSFRRGQQAITFANGDKLFGVYSGSLLPTPTTASDGRVIIDGLYRNVGGTGQLTHAHGRGVSAGAVNIATGSAEVTVTGTL